MFNGEDIQSLSFVANQERIGNFLRMEFGGDPSTPVFNGYLAKIQLRLGSGAWVSDKDGFKMLYQGELALPDKLKLNQERVTVPILKDEEKVDSTKEREP